MRRPIALLVFIIFQIIFLPASIIGAILVGYRQLAVSKQLGVSQTAVEIINGRWTMHIFGLREDPAADKLLSVLPNSSTTGLWMALLPLYVYYQISGETRWYPVIKEAGEEGLAQLVLNRTGYFDGIIDRAKDDAQQFVILGSGLDTRAYNGLKHSHLKIFELDQSVNLRYKLKYIQEAGIDKSHITYIETDFAQDEWIKALIDAGYDPAARTIFLWEGVTLYLSERSVRSTLQTLKANAAAGSVIAADIYAQSFVTGEYTRSLKPVLPVLDLTDEGFGFGLEMSGDYHQTLKTFAASEGLSLGETHFMGYKTDKGAYMVVAELKI